jgi:hypothetical protein
MEAMTNRKGEHVQCWHMPEQRILAIRRINEWQPQMLWWRCSAP